MADVFISYSRKDKNFVSTLHITLKAHHRETWVDWQDIPLTADWWQEIERGIEAANTFVFVLSADSVESRVCLQEVDHAVKHNKRLVPVVRRDDFDGEKVHSALRKHNWLFFRECDDFDSAFQLLITAIDTDLDHVKQHTRILVRASEWEHKHRNSDLLLRGSELESVIQWLTQNAEKEPRFTELQRNYINESRKAESVRQATDLKREKRARRAITAALIASVGGLVVTTGLGLFAFRQYQTATVNEMNATSTSSKALFDSGQELDALVAALKAVHILKSATWADEESRQQVTSALQQAVYGVKERNRWKGHNGYTASVSFSPDGAMIASGGKDKVVKLWSNSGQLLRIFNGHNAAVSSVSFSPDSRTIASAYRDGTIKLWSINGQELRSFKGHPAWISLIRFSPDGKILASAGADHTLKLWHLNGQAIRTIQPEASGKLGSSGDFGVSSISFSPDSQKIAFAEFNAVRLWDVKGKELQRFTGHFAPVMTVAFSPDGKTIASSGWDRHIRLWSLDGREVQDIQEESYGDQSNSRLINEISFSPDGKTIASANARGNVKLWSVDGQGLQSFQADTNGISSISFSPDGGTIVAGSDNGMIRRWNLQTTELQTLKQNDTDGVQDLQFSPDGKLLAIAGYNGVIKLRDASGQEKKFAGHSNAVSSVRFSPDGKMIASGSNDVTVFSNDPKDATVKLWDLDGRLIQTYKGHKGGVISVSFSPDGKLLASAGWEDGTVRLWDIKGQLLKTMRHPVGVGAASFSPDGQLIATVTYDQKINLWNIKGQKLRTLTTSVYQFTISPNGRLVATATTENTINLWSLDGHLVRTLTGHKDTIRKMAFSPDGQTLASVSSDRTIKLWSLKGQELKTLIGHEGDVDAVAFSPDGKTLVSGSFDKTIRFWNAETLDFDQLVVRGCNWVRDYLKYNPDVKERDRQICAGVKQSLNGW